MSKLEVFQSYGNEHGYGLKKVNEVELAEPVGRKDDQEKLRYSLLFACGTALRHVVRQLMFGADRYGDHNWRKVEANRYEEALLRHAAALAEGRWIDDGPGGSGEPHAAAIVCCCLFLMEHRAAKDVSK